MGKNSITIRVSPDLQAELDDYCDRNGYSRSAGARTLLRRQLRDEIRLDELRDRVVELEATADVGDLEERVADLEQRVEDLERRPWWWPG